MSTGVKTAVGKFVWHDHNSTDPEKAKTFYAELLGWETEVWKPGEMDYPMIKAGGQMHGGFGQAQGGAPSHWLGHVLVENVDETTQRTTSAGGNVIAPAFDIPEVGRMAVLADPQGAVLSAFTPTGEMTPSEGTFLWDELMTSDVEAAKRFYGEVFGWTADDQSMADFGSYTVFKRSGGEQAAGCMAIPEGMQAPPHWTPYLATDDADKTAKQAKKLGGTIYNEPMDIPEVGRFAVIADPTGAAFGILKPSSS